MPARREIANALRILSMDAVQKANSGHPGMPMGMADIAEVLFNDFLSFNPKNPHWANRDRFILSNGHGSMLQYALLYLTGYDLSLDDIKNFRQLGSKTPGHPENFVTPGIETTTGPLGQGLANAVGMALAESILAARFNKKDVAIVDHYTYCFVGDGCLMEGISHEVASLAGTLSLGKLIVFYDDNGISIDGKTQGWFTDDTPDRFEAYGWQVIRKVDGHDSKEIKQAILTAHKTPEQPTLICCKTIIGWGSPNKKDTADVHGAALGEAEVKAARQELGWQDETPFAIPEKLKAAWNKTQVGAEKEQSWQTKFDAYKASYPEQAAEFERRMAGQLPTGWQAFGQELIEQIQRDGAATATRKSSKAILSELAKVLPELVGGSADLSGSNGTNFAGHKVINAQDYDGNYVKYGVREFGMTAIANGLKLHGGILPFTATFLIFSDYARNAVRMASLMSCQQILVYTHDSIGLGEDGPTHQPVDQLSTLRLIPNLHVWRPADDVETAAAWCHAVSYQNGPSALALTRQNVPHYERNAAQLELINRGGYVLYETNHQPQAIIMATGSEVELALAAAHELEQEGLSLRVVSIPCLDIFEQQDADYINQVLPEDIKARVAIEAGVTPLWRGYVGQAGQIIGIDRFGLSAPGDQAMAELAITREAVSQAIKEQV